MAEKYPSGNTPWSTAANWNGGTLPQPGDDVHANNFTVTIDQNVDVGSLRTTAGATAVAGGGFTTAVSRTVTASGTGIVAGTTTCLTLTGASGQTLAVNGNVQGGASSGARGITSSNTGTVTVIGTVTGGSAATTPGVGNTSSGTINVTGNATGGSGTAANGITGNSGTVTLTGNATGGSASGGNVGLALAAGGTGTVNGNVVGGSNANCQGSSLAANAVLTVNGNLVPATGNAIESASTGKVILNGNIQSASTGVAPFGSAGALLVIKSTTTLAHAYRTDSGGSIGAERVLTTDPAALVGGYDVVTQAEQFR